ncbi:neutrophil gelatinase-associated lipocalin-like isoform X1 [Crocuta crocuta]
MALGPLWLGLALWGALHTQAQDSTPNMIPAPPLLRLPVEPDFQNKQFQGKWYVIGVAGYGFKKEDNNKLKMYIDTYELNEDNSYNFTSALGWGQNCDHWTKSHAIDLHVGQLNLGNIERYNNYLRYTTRVVTTDYNQFAIMHFKKVYNNKQEHLKIALYGRTKELPTELKELFISFAKSLGLTENNVVFTLPNGVLWLSPPHPPLNDLYPGHDPAVPTSLDTTERGKRPFLLHSPPAGPQTALLTESLWLTK